MQEKLSAFCGFDKTTKALTHIYCQSAISGKALREWFASMEFEALPPDITCMAAAAGAAIQFDAVPEALIPRLRGIVKYVHTLNSGMISGICALGAACNRKQLPVLLLEDTALYMRYPDAPQRHLWQLCMGVDKAQYEKVLALAQENGFTLERFPNAAVARQGVTRQIVIRPVESGSYLWSNATELKKGAVSFLCPEPAAMLIEACQRAFRTLTKPKPRAFLVRWCMDMKLLTARLRDEDWHRGQEIAANENARCHIRLLFALYEAIADIRLDAAEQFGTAKDAQRTLRLLRAFIACPESGQKLRRVYLLYRLRRPDSIPATVLLLVRQVLKKRKR